MSKDDKMEKTETTTLIPPLESVAPTKIPEPDAGKEEHQAPKQPGDIKIKMEAEPNPAKAVLNELEKSFTLARPDPARGSTIVTKAIRICLRCYVLTESLRQLDQAITQKRTPASEAADRAYALLTLPRVQAEEPDNLEEPYAKTLKETAAFFKAQYAIDSSAVSIFQMAYLAEINERFKSTPYVNFHTPTITINNLSSVVSFSSSSSISFPGVPRSQVIQGPPPPPTITFGFPMAQVMQASQSSLTTPTTLLGQPSRTSQPQASRVTATPLIGSGSPLDQKTRKRKESLQDEVEKEKLIKTEAKPEEERQDPAPR